MSIICIDYNTTECYKINYVLHSLTMIASFRNIITYHGGFQPEGVFLLVYNDLVCQASVKSPAAFSLEKFHILGDSIFNTEVLFRVFNVIIHKGQIDTKTGAWLIKKLPKDSMLCDAL